MASTEAMVVTPVPPMPVKTMLRTPASGSNVGSGVESAVRAGIDLAWAFSPPSMVMKDGQKPCRQE